MMRLRLNLQFFAGEKTEKATPKKRKDTRKKGRKTCSDECHRRYYENKYSLTITKEELQKLVWEIPTEKIGKMYGVSGKAVEKRCKKYGIEKPPRGYWAKKRST